MRDCLWPVSSIGIAFTFDSVYTPPGATTVTTTAAASFTLTRKPFADYLIDSGLGPAGLCQDSPLARYSDDGAAGLAPGEFVLVMPGDGASIILASPASGQCCAPCWAALIMRPPADRLIAGTQTTEEDGEDPVTVDLYATINAYAIHPVSSRFNRRTSRALTWEGAQDDPPVPPILADIALTMAVAGTPETNAELTIIADPGAEATVLGSFSYLWTAPDGCELRFRGSRVYAIGTNILVDRWTGSFQVLSVPAGQTGPTDADIRITAETGGIRIAFIGRYAHLDVDEPALETNETVCGSLVDVNTHTNYHGGYASDSPPPVSDNAFSKIGIDIYDTPDPEAGPFIVGILSGRTVFADSECPQDYSGSHDWSLTERVQLDPLPADSTVIRTSAATITVTWS